MKIGNLNFEKSVFLAPMAGVTDISFRGLCKEMGCGLVYILPVPVGICAITDR